MIMTPTALLIQAILIVALLMSAGCKVHIFSHNVGGVVSASGVHNCPAGQSCQFDVVDIHFRDTFRGYAGHPNYRFAGWLAGDRNLCGGMKRPCTLITENFAGNPALLQILESDESFVLIPKFERLGAVERLVLDYRRDGNPRVYDADGRLVGTLNVEPGTRFAKGVNIHLEGYGKSYILRVEYNGFTYQVSTSESDLAYSSGECAGEPLPSLIVAVSPSPGSGLLPGNARAPVIVGAGSQLYVPDPIGSVRGASWSHRWDSGERACLEVQGESGGLVPLVPIAAELEYPLSIEGSSDIIDRPFPDSLVF